MSQKFRVINDSYYQRYGLEVGDIVTKVKGSKYDDLYKLPKRLHGKGHTAKLIDTHLKLKTRNYLYLSEDDLEEIKEELK